MYQDYPNAKNYMALIGSLGWGSKVARGAMPLVSHLNSALPAEIRTEPTRHKEIIRLVDKDKRTLEQAFLMCMA